jgi:TPR repeat protein
MSTDSERLALGVAAYGVPEYARAFRILMPLAERGFPEAQAIIGDFYLLGLGGVVPVDGPEAVRWYREAAGGGYALSCWNLYSLYTSGLPGVTPNADEATAFREKAVVLGFDMVPGGSRDI